MKNIISVLFFNEDTISVLINYCCNAIVKGYIHLFTLLIYYRLDGLIVINMLTIPSYAWLYNEACVADMGNWMNRNMLRLNFSKTEFIVFLSTRHVR